MMGKFPAFETERLYLRQFEKSDLKNVYQGLSHPQVIKYYGVSFDSLEATKAQLDWFADLEKNGTGVWWAINEKSSKDFMGAAGFNDLSQEHKKAEIGFWLLPEFWKQGIITEVIPLLLTYAFDQLGLHRIEAYVEPENSNSKKVLESFNFHYEGTMRDCEVKDGNFISLDIYARFDGGSVINKGEK